MSQRKAVLSRAQLIGGVLATGALAACGGGANGAAPIAPLCNAMPAASAADRFGINEIFSHEVFNGLDKQALLRMFDPSPSLEALHQGYLAQSAQRPQISNVILDIPSQGIVIQTPGAYRLGRDIQWYPQNATSSAITIQCGNVTLDFGGFTLTASVSDKSQQITGVLVSGPATGVTISNGTVSGVTEYGILAKNVCNLNVLHMTVTGVCMQNLVLRNLTPTGILVSSSHQVAITGCNVINMAVTSDSSAGIQLIGTDQATVSYCSISGLVNNDGAVQGFSYIGCTNVMTVGCSADTFQSHFHTNILTTGHTVIGYCPIFCLNLDFVDCSATGLTGCCDDCHGMSVFLDAFVTVTGFRASQIVDGVSPSNSGAKATGLEVYGAAVTLTDCVVSDIRAINPQDKQSAGFSTWGALIKFERCEASNVTVHDDLGGCRGVGFGWAPDPRIMFRYIGAFASAYIDCKADSCDVGFDTWYHIDSTWTRPIFTNCTTGFLVEPGGTRTISGDPCSECNPPITVTLTNIASGNTYPP